MGFPGVGIKAQTWLRKRQGQIAHLTRLGLVRRSAKATQHHFCPCSFAHARISASQYGNRWILDRKSEPSPESLNREFLNILYECHGNQRAAYILSYTLGISFVMLTVSKCFRTCTKLRPKFLINFLNGNQLRTQISCLDESGFSIIFRLYCVQLGGLLVPRTQSTTGMATTTQRHESSPSPVSNLFDGWS